MKCIRAWKIKQRRASLHYTHARLASENVWHKLLSHQRRWPCRIAPRDIEWAIAAMRPQDWHGVTLSTQEVRSLWLSSGRVRQTDYGNIEVNPWYESRQWD